MPPFLSLSRYDLGKILTNSVCYVKVRAWNFVALALIALICHLSHINKWLLLDGEHFEMCGNEKSFWLLLELPRPNYFAIIYSEAHLLFILFRGESKKLEEKTKVKSNLITSCHSNKFIRRRATVRNLIKYLHSPTCFVGDACCVTGWGCSRGM